jgi:hypothetical protein
LIQRFGGIALVLRGQPRLQQPLIAELLLDSRGGALEQGCQQFMEQ